MSAIFTLCKVIQKTHRTCMMGCSSYSATLSGQSSNKDTRRGVLADHENSLDPPQLPPKCQQNPINFPSDKNTLPLWALRPPQAPAQLLHSAQPETSPSRFLDLLTSPEDIYISRTVPSKRVSLVLPGLNEIKPFHQLKICWKLPTNLLSGDTGGWVSS